jgi:Flp pilus assembly protein TadB
LLYINPGYLELLVRHPLGKTLISLAVGAQIAAYFVIRRIVDIKV